MKKKLKTPEIKHTANQERYLITYADLLTLLFALFVILYSFSHPDAEKMQEVLRAMNNVFNPNQIIEGNNLSPDISSQTTPPVILFPSKIVDISEIQENMESALEPLIKNNNIELERIPDGMKLKIPNKFLFPSAKATLLATSTGIIDSIATVLAAIDMQIQVDGHTDAVPIRSFNYASNWELSSARAVGVVQALIKKGVPAHNLVARAYGEQRPIADNTSEEGREKNRRVEITITTKDDNVATTSN